MLLLVVGKLALKFWCLPDARVFGKDGVLAAWLLLLLLALFSKFMKWT